MANQPKKYKKFVATAATATLVASAIVPVASAASLSDIAGNTHEAAINALVDAGVISGYPDGTFQPNKQLTRSDVVKLLGKYLVTEGFEVPTDYKSNPRFSDLTSASNDELLKYAAVVADAGVFAGSNGKLLAGDAITRENMAIVLVRMVNTLNDVNLEAYVASQDFNREVKDINAAKAEARTAIDVLDFYDITTVANFLPKNTVTRGQFATFLNNVINADFAGASATTGVVKVINNTTVEVTFADDIADIKALDFKISGLEVSNAVVKQSDRKTVVLTTSAQTAGTEYTVTVNGDEVGKFVGVSAVIPTKVELVAPSVQGKLGQQVSVQAKVTVADGQSKAGIPVTFSVPGNNTDAVDPTITGEAFTDENGVATYTYTRYAAKTDAVTAYATGDRSKFAVGYVFWGVDTIVSITEVTEGATINNGANKTYKITYKSPTTGQPVANKTFNVSVLENINVTADKAQNVTVNGVAVAQLSNSTVTRAAQITTDSKGEATFTVSGNHATVTPVVFDASLITGTNNVYNQAYTASALQATAPKVTFAAVQAAYTIEMTREGGEIAAIGASNGGREYKVVVKDKDGKLAANEIVNVAFNEDLDKVIATETEAQFIDTTGSTQVFYTGPQAKQIAVKTNAKGEATFVVGSTKLNDYVTPIAWIDINTANANDANLDNGEPTAIGTITHFQQQYVDGASVSAYNSTTKTTKFNGNETATFKTALTNQSGLTYNATTTTITNVTYTVTNTGAANVEVNDNGIWRTVSPNRSITISPNPVADLEVKPVTDSTTSIKVTATGNATYTDAVTSATKTFAFTAKEATATFTKVGEVPTAGHTGVITAYDTVNKTITFAGKNPVKYAGETGKTYVFKGLGGATIPDGATGFLAILATNTVTASYSVDGDTVTFAIVGQTGGSATATNPTVSASAPGGLYTVGDTVAITLTFSENVTYTAGGTPSTLALSNGATATYTTSGANTLTYTYTVAAAQDASTVTVTGVTLNGATIVGNITNAPANTSSFTANLTGVVVDTVKPTATVDTTGNTANGFTIVPSETGTTVAITTGGNNLAGGEVVSVLGNVFTVSNAGAADADTFEFTVTDAAGNVTTYDATYAVATGWSIVAQ
ncbi:S-layer homology domain-containing protein [Metasolibacillus sp. FSL K6-0083]|uniref:S-layer homology domain-containing protein n=1 Tax=Metasolibacillus sp. FSL K6-0083 TaxID=2921416 RepID=UPI00315A73D8